MDGGWGGGGGGRIRVMQVLVVGPFTDFIHCTQKLEIPFIMCYTAYAMFMNKKNLCCLHRIHSSSQIIQQNYISNNSLHFRSFGGSTL